VSGDGAAPLFVLGAPRSGTSLLYKQLCLHPQAAWISNWARRAPGLPALALLNRLAPRLPDARRRTWFGADGAEAYVYLHPRRLAERLFPMPVEGEPLYRRCGVSADPTAAPVPTERLRAAFAAIERWSGGRVLVSKRIANNLRIPLLAAAFPTARFVHLVRDGRAVAYSLSRVDWWEDGVVWWYGGTPRRWREEGRDPWELCAMHWVRELAAIRSGLGAVPEDQRLEVRYEHLVQAPVAVAERVAAFAGLPPDPAWSAELARLRYPAARVDAWRERLSPEARRRIEQVQRADLDRLGHTT
jgi:Sulfotransferase family